MRRSGLSVLCILLGMLIPFTPAWAQLQTLAQRCQNDALPADLAEARLEWMRTCALTVNINNPSNGYGIGDTAFNTGAELVEYSEGDINRDPYGYNRYVGSLDSYDINTTYSDLLYLSGAITQTVDANGYYQWTRQANRKKTRPRYPIFGNDIDVGYSYNTQLFPHPTLTGCQLYTNKSGTGSPSSFYVNGYCDSAPISPLSNNVATSALSESTGNGKYYSLTVPAGAGKLIIETSGGTGEADLYVRIGKSPTLSDYTCRPLLNGNTESCVIDNPAAGTWYVMLNARSSYSGVVLTARYPLINVDTAGCQTNVAINNAIAQSFRVPSSTALERFELWIKPELYYTTSYAVELYDSEGTSGPRLATSTSLTLGSQTGGVPSTWYSFSFSVQGLVLQANHAYTLKLVRLSQYSGAFSRCGNVYPNGIEYWLGYSADYGNDLSFRLYGTAL